MTTIHLLEGGAKRPCNCVSLFVNWSSILCQILVIRSASRDPKKGGTGTHPGTLQRQKVSYSRGGRHADFIPHKQLRPYHNTSCIVNKMEILQLIYG